MTMNDVDAVYDRLTEDDDDLVLCVTDDRGRNWYYKRSQVFEMNSDDVEYYLSRCEQLMSFSNKEGIRWLTKEDAVRLYPNWPGHKE